MKSKQKLKADNKAADSSASLRSIKVKRCIAIAAVCAVYIIFMFFIMNNISVTLSLWEFSLPLIIAAAVAFIASVWYAISYKSHAATTLSRVFVPSIPLGFTAIFLIWTIIFKISANVYTPVFIAFYFAVAIIAFIGTNFGADAFLFSTFTFAAAGAIWLIKILSIFSRGAFGIALIITLMIIFSLLLALIFRIRENNGSLLLLGRKIKVLTSGNSSVWPFFITLLITLVSNALSIFALGYEMYFLTAMLIWFIVFCIMKAVQIIEA